MTKEGFERQSIGAPDPSATYSPSRDWVGEAMAKQMHERDAKLRRACDGCAMIVMLAGYGALLMAIGIASMYYDRWYFQNWLMGGR